MKKIHYRLILVASVVFLSGFFLGRWTLNPEMQRPAEQEKKRISSVPKQMSMRQGTPSPVRNKKPELIVRDMEPQCRDKAASGQGEEPGTLQNTESTVNEKVGRPQEPMPVLPHQITVEDDQTLSLLEKENEDLQVELAESLSSMGVPEDEIMENLEGIAYLSRPEKMEPWHEPPSPAQLREDIATALYELGASEEEIYSMVEDFMQATQGEQSPLLPSMGRDNITGDANR